MGTIPACVRTGSRSLEWRGAGSDHAARGPQEGVGVVPGKGREALGSFRQGERATGGLSEAPSAGGWSAAQMMPEGSGEMDIPWATGGT